MRYSFLSFQFYRKNIYILIAFFIYAGLLSAQAHPHVWVKAQSVIVYGADGSPDSIRHAWTFDESFSSFATQGLDSNGDGKLSREELKDLAQTNVTSLAEFEFFTFGIAGPTAFTAQTPHDYWLDFDGKVLTLNFTLNLNISMPKTAPFSIEIYDPTYFVDFSWANSTAVTLENAPASCKAEIQTPTPQTPAAGQPLTEDFFNSLTAQSNFGEKFANAVFVGCSPEALAAARSDLSASKAAPQQSSVAPEESQPAAIIKREDRLPPAPADTTAPQKSCQLGAFGVIRPDGTLTSNRGFFGWIAAGQAQFYQALSRNVSADASSSWIMLVLVGFLYGVFHAAGPGHGKAVISSYLVANGETLKRGIVLSFLSAGMQAFSAIAIVGIFALVLGAGSRAMGIAAFWMELLSYAAIAVLGLWLIIRAVKKLSSTNQMQGAGNCGHSHGPDVAALEQQDFSWRHALPAIAAVGLRPCTGAILILSLSLSQGLLEAGIAATFAMALGTAITVSMIAAIAVYAKHIALWLASSSIESSRWMTRILELGAGSIILLFGIFFLCALFLNGLPTNC
jgi:nickel/cobalt exporter